MRAGIHGGNILSSKESNQEEMMRLSEAARQQPTETVQVLDSLELLFGVRL